MKKVTQPDYQSYLLRLWRDGESAPWRASLENTSTGEARTFAEIQMMTAFLMDVAGEGPAEVPPTTKPRDGRGTR